MFQAAVISEVPFNYVLMEKLWMSGLLLNLATDMTITGFTLWKIRNGANSYSSASRHGLKRLRNIVVEAAVPPTLCGLLNFIVILALGHEGMIPIGLVLVTPSLYVWSMMFTLNSRPAIRQAFNAPREAAEEDRTLSTHFQFAELPPSKVESSDADTQLATADLGSIPEGPQLAGLPVGPPKESTGGVLTTQDSRHSKDQVNLV
ncbi:hypothetical protein FRB90_009815 [Tulasnella sp. 427]|nr:hypothetical protein FRB90_009815 [Tulasnella sp. 427]